MPDKQLVIRGANPRRNLPGHLSRKRKESNFLCAFERTYSHRITGRGIVGRDIEVFGYGIADWLWFAWRSPLTLEDATALSLEKIPRSFRLIAFELKITDWRQALQQATRYSYFADRAVVVLPPAAAELALKHRKAFVDLRISLWAFDAKTGRIKELFNAKNAGPRSATARSKAIRLLLRRAKLSKLGKLRQPLAKRLKVGAV